MFVSGQHYSRKDIYQLLDVPITRQGGNWDTGYTSYNGVYYVFVNINEPGRTGHNYGNHWKGDKLSWSGKTKLHVDQPTIRALTDHDTMVHIFTREDNTLPFFKYEGTGKAENVENTTPVRITWRIKRLP